MKKFWTLRCDDTMQKYVWKRIEVGHSTLQAHSLTREEIYPRRVIDSTGVAVITQGLVLVMAENGLWRYSLASNQWYHLDSPFPAFKEYQLDDSGFLLPQFKDVYFVSGRNSNDLQFGETLMEFILFAWRNT